MYKEERERRGRRRRRKLERGENSKSFSFVTSLVISYTHKLSPRISANHPSSSLSLSLPLSLTALFLAILNREHHSRGGARGLKGSSVLTNS